MNNDIKTHYIWGFKDGLAYGIEKGIELAEYFAKNDCPSNTAPVMIDGGTASEESTATE